jgi:hypothetical protein
MGTSFNLADVSNVNASYGRGVVFYADKFIMGASALVMSQLGVTEGDIVITPNGATAGLTIPELTGPAKHEMDYLGEDPVVEIPLYLADPALIAIVSPSGSAHAGRSRRGPVKEYTLAVFPEALFLEADSEGIVSQRTVAFDGSGTWTFNGLPLTSKQQEYLDASFWLWRVVFNRPTRRFRGGAGDEKKNIETVSTQAMHHPDMPEGHHIYTTGDPFEFDINLNDLGS